MINLAELKFVDAHSMLSDVLTQAEEHATSGDMNIANNARPLVILSGVLLKVLDLIPAENFDANPVEEPPVDGDNATTGTAGVDHINL